MGLYQFNNNLNSYMMEEENNETSVEKGHSDHDTLVFLERSEHLIQEGVQVRKTAHEDTNGYKTAFSVLSLYDVVR